MKMFLQVTAVLALALLFSTFIIAAIPSGKTAEEEKRECMAAMLSSYGTSTYNYADKKAYDDHVRDKCAGFTFNGKPLAP